MTGLCDTGKAARTTQRERELHDALRRLHVAAENFYRGRGPLDSFRLKCALNGTRKLARETTS